MEWPRKNAKGAKQSFFSRSDGTCSIHLPGEGIARHPSVIAISFYAPFVPFCGNLTAAFRVISRPMIHRRGGALPRYRRFAKNKPETLAATLATSTFRAKPSPDSLHSMTSCPQIVNPQSLRNDFLWGGNQQASLVWIYWAFLRNWPSDETDCQTVA